VTAAIATAGQARRVTELAAPDLHASLGALVHRLASRGDRPALLTADGAVTYGELAVRVADLAERLGPTRRLVLLPMTNTVEAVTAYLAALAGGHPVLLTADTPDSLDALRRAYDPDVVLRAGGGTVELLERRTGTSHDLHPDLALLLSTSGSTGSPKLVRLSRGNLLANATAIADYLDLRQNDRAITSLPAHYCYGLSVLHSHLLRGAAVVLTDLSVVDACFWDLARRHRVTSLAGVPFTFELLDRAGFAEMDLPHLRYVTQAGGRLPPDRVRRFAELGQRRGWDLFVMYGQTEATARMAYLPPEHALTHAHTIGRPIPGGAFALEPVDGVEDGTGELVYRGPNVMLGYAEHRADLALGATVDRLRTGDLARRTGPGLYEIVGRRSRFAKLFGLRLDLERLEARLAEDGTAALLAEADGALVAAVAGGAAPRPVQQRLAAMAGIPARAVVVVPVPELPRLSNGKPDHAAVRALAPAGLPTPEPRRPAADVLTALQDLYGDVLDLSDVDPDSTFVGLGGDSLSYVELSVRLEELLGRLPAGWHTAPLRELARASGPAPAVTAAVPLRRLRPVETSVVLRAVGILVIVSSHAGLFTLQGGAHVLLAVAGFNLARFQLTGSPPSVRAARLLRGVTRVAVPSVVWIAVVHAVTGFYSWQNVALVNAFLGPDVFGPTWQYWFVETLVWTVLATALLLRLPVVDRAERAAPFGFAMVLLGMALLLRFGVVVLDTGPDRWHTPHLVLWFFLAGWAAARATTQAHRLAVTAAVLLALPGYFATMPRTLLVLGGLLLLIWCRTLPVPARLVGPAVSLASASLYVYLTHFQVLHVFDSAAAEVAASLAVGLLYARLADAVPRWLRGQSQPLRLNSWCRARQVVRMTPRTRK
jgi:acyl-CoA synthetase (AMP-forming)/AMP-acid ligase II